MTFISTQTILHAFDKLTEVEVKNASILHIFLILKGCGINDTIALPTSVISTKGYQIAKDLSFLFSHFEKSPEKYDFINPFSMKKWGKQAPSETLKTWVAGRIKNNIIGGATTWRKIIREDLYNDKIKFANDYINEIKNLTVQNKKIGLWALAIWFNRFNKFKNSFSPNELIQSFSKELFLSEKEISALFDRSVDFDMSYSEDECDMQKIRKRIGVPPNSGRLWENSTVIEIKEPDAYYQYKERFMNHQTNVPIEKILKLLTDNFQIILSGPPGTSKSYIADIVSKKIVKDRSCSESVLKIQFHPQYSYQDFVGGFIVNGDKVEANRGVFLRFLDRVKKNNNENFVLIIDEINRSNVGSVFGELIQCLDRNYSISILIAGKEEIINIPKNLFIIATMNTSDRTLCSIDFALRRRFIDIYIAPNEESLTDTTKAECKISLADLLKKINSQLRKILRSNELVIGQAIFYVDSVKDNNVYYWTNERLEDLYNYKILSIIEDYCNRDLSKINEIVGDKLKTRLVGQAFIDALLEYIS